MFFSLITSTLEWKTIRALGEEDDEYAKRSFDIFVRQTIKPMAVNQYNHKENSLRL